MPPWHAHSSSCSAHKGLGFKAKIKFTDNKSTVSHTQVTPTQAEQTLHNCDNDMPCRDNYTHYTCCMQATA